MFSDPVSFIGVIIVMHRKSEKNKQAVKRQIKQYKQQVITRNFCYISVSRSEFRHRKTQEKRQTTTFKIFLIVCFVITGF